jgi:hypothetical protein
MIKLIPLVKEEKKPINEGNITKAEDIKANPKLWKFLKYELQKQFYELEKIGQDYGVFQNAQGTAKILKQIRRLMGKI